ncbi:NinB protein [compost metagenome]
MEIREPTRSDEQNRALWSLLGQIQKARPVHNGVQMDTETWKCLFLHALGREVRFVPTLDGSSMLPLGLRSSRLTKREFSDLLELILAWCAANEVEVQHFDAANDDHAPAQGEPA